MSKTKFQIGDIVLWPTGDNEEMPIGRVVGINNLNRNRKRPLYNIDSIDSVNCSCGGFFYEDELDDAGYIDFQDRIRDRLE